MKNAYGAVLILIILAVVAVLAFGPLKNIEKVQAPSAGETPKVPVSSSVREFTVTGQNFSFTPSMIRVKKGDRVKINFQNTNGFHNFVIDEFNVATPTIERGAQASVEFTADKAGNFEYYCSVGTHRAMGMRGTLVVE